jgi:hypothetical protein
MVPFTAGDAEHEETDPAKHCDDDEQQGEDRPTGGVTSAIDHGYAASGTGDKAREVHDGGSVKES